jgi:hypothetical protein
MNDTIWKLLALSGVVAGLGYLVWSQQPISKPSELFDPSLPPVSKPPSLSDPSFPKPPKSQTYLSTYTPDIERMFI